MKLLGLRSLTCAGLLIGGGAAVGGVTARADSASAPCATPRVAGVSYALDIFETGSKAGPSIIYGLAKAGAGQALPGPLAKYQSQLLAEGGKYVVVFSKDGPAGIEALRHSIGPFAALNGPVNGGLAATGNAMNGVATNFGPSIQPFDRTLNQVAAIVVANQEPAGGCPAS
jgi:hypothetical protein